MARYPSLASIERAVRGLGAEVRALDATSLAQEAGNLRIMNVVMIGALASTRKASDWGQDAQAGRTGERSGGDGGCEPTGVRAGV